MKEHTEIQYFPKETLDERTNTLYLDHRTLIRKEIKVKTLTEEEKNKSLIQAFKDFSKNYNPDYILNFKPSNIKKVHLYFNPFGQEPIQAAE